MQVARFISLPLPSPYLAQPSALLPASGSCGRSLSGGEAGSPEGQGRGRGCVSARARALLPPAAGAGARSSGPPGTARGRGEGAAPAVGAVRGGRGSRGCSCGGALGPASRLPPGRSCLRGRCSGAMYRSGARSSVSSHRSKESGGGGPGTGRSSGSSGPVRRTSPPSSSSSSRTPARRPRSPSGHRGRRASPSPPRGRRGTPSPPRGRRASPSPPRGRRVSQSPPRARRGSPSPPRSRRLFPPGSAGFRGSSRGESRSDFARDGRGDHPGDSGSRVIPPLDRTPSIPQPRRPRFRFHKRPPHWRPRQARVPKSNARYPHGPPRRRPNLEVPCQSRELHLHSNGLGTRLGAWSGDGAPFPGNRLFLSLGVKCGKVCNGEGNFLQTVCLVLLQ